jgi:aminoglycoside 2''-phosphotransferase
MVITPESLVEKLVAADVAIESWSLLGSGDNNLALLVNNQWVYRFPLNSGAADSQAQEVDILRAVHGRLPVPTPNPEIVVTIPDFNWPIVAYRAIAGGILDQDEIDLLDAAQLSRLGRDLGRFMTTLHGSPRSLFGESKIRVHDNRERWDKLVDDARQFLQPRIESSSWNRLIRKLSKTVAKIRDFEFDPVLRHGDLGFSNLLFDPAMRLTGVIDFGSAGYGDPATDIAALIAVNGAGEVMIEKLRPAYPAVDDLVGRARIYRETFALQHALWGAKVDDELAVEEGLASYIGG